MKSITSTTSFSVIFLHVIPVVPVSPVVLFYL